MSDAAASTNKHPVLVSEETFNATREVAYLTRVHRYVLWSLVPDSPCFLMPDTPKTHIWFRIAEHSTVTGLKCRASGPRAFLITEEHHDVLGNRYTTSGDRLESNWQPEGPGLIHTIGNPGHWIAINRLIPGRCMAPIAITDIAPPDGWTQPNKPHYLDNSDVWIHFTPVHGPFNITRVVSRFQAPRHTTTEMRAFLGDKLTETPSAADLTTATIAYIYVNKLIDTQTNKVSPDEALSAVVGGSTPFDITDLQALLAPHYGEFA